MTETQFISSVIDLLGSGEFYDRLEPLPPSSSPSNPPPAIFSHFSLLYDEAAGNAGNRNADRTSLDRKGMSRQSNHTSSVVRTHPPHMSRDPSMGVASGTNRHPLSPSDIDYQLFSPTGSGSSRENTIPRQHQRNSSYDSRSSVHPSDSASSASITYASGSVGIADAPIRGSGSKDRNRPERGSGRNHTPQMGVSGTSPDLMNGYATLPRSSSHHREVGLAGASMDTVSLENFRLEDKEVNMAFRRDNPGRISITKKSEWAARELSAKPVDLYD